MRWNGAEYDMREPTLIPDKVCNVRDFGARGDGTTSDTAAITGAIAACAGGGHIVLPAPGAYVSGTLTLTSNQELCVRRGAVLLGSAARDDYPLLPAFPSYGRARDVTWAVSRVRHAALVRAVDAANVSVRCGGEIHGRGAEFWWPAFDRRELAGSRPRLLSFERCDGVELERLTLRDSPFWTVHLIYSHRVRARLLTILAPAARGNTDGIVVDSSADVEIEHCHIATGDDGVVIKSGMDGAGRAVGAPSSAIVVRDVTTRGVGGFAIGSEMSGGVENVTFDNVKLLGQRGFHIKFCRGRGGYVRDINWANIPELRRSPGQYPLFRMSGRYSGCNASGPYPRVGGFHFRNCPALLRYQVVKACGVVGTHWAEDAYPDAVPAGLLACPS